MFLGSTSEVRVEMSGADVSYFFPPRPLGKARLIGLLPIGFSVLLFASPLHGAVRELLHRNHGDNPLFAIGAVALAAFVLVMGALPACFGLLVMFGRCRVDWRDGRLSVTDYLGPIRQRRRFPKQPIRKLTVAGTGAAPNVRPITSGPLATLGALGAEYEPGNTRWVILGYPRDWLEDLARELAQRTGASTSVAAAPAIERVEPGEAGIEPAEVVEKPAGSRVTVESRIHGVLLTVPPAGLRKGGKGLLAMGLIWCLFISVFTFGPMFSDEGANHDGFGFLILLPFWLVGLGLLGGAIHMARRRATLSVDHGTLSVTQSGLFGTKVNEWLPGSIAAVRADKSGMVVNDTQILELQVHPFAGKKAGLLAGRDEAELRWIATELRKALNVPAERSAGGPPASR